VRGGFDCRFEVLSFVGGCEALAPVGANARSDQAAELADDAGHRRRRICHMVAAAGQDRPEIDRNGPCCGMA
jgi:hypothetical protein